MEFFGALGPAAAPMTPSEAQKRIAALRSEVAAHDERYYRQARPEVSDQEYDQLKRELAGLESKYPDAARAAERTRRPTRWGTTARRES